MCGAREPGMGKRHLITCARVCPYKCNGVRMRYRYIVFTPIRISGASYLDSAAEPLATSVKLSSRSSLVSRTMFQIIIHVFYATQKKKRKQTKKRASARNLRCPFETIALADRMIRRGSSCKRWRKWFYRAGLDRRAARQRILGDSMAVAVLSLVTSLTGPCIRETLGRNCQVGCSLRWGYPGEEARTIAADIRTG